jgi:glycosyltransferase involved in cell wall biosynthesis
MLLHKSVVRDSRVRREASALAEAGHAVTVVELDREASGSLDGFARVSAAPPDRVRSLPSAAYRAVFLAAFVARAIRLRPDVIHAHDAAMLLPGLIAARLTRARLVYDSHELATGVPYRWSRGWARFVAAVERLAVPRCAEVITVSDGIAARLQARYGRARRPVVVRNASALRPAPPDGSLRAALGIGDAPLVLHQGATARDRGCDVLVAAMRLVPGAHLVFLGDEGEPGFERRLRVLAEQVPGRVHFHPSVPLEHLVGATAEADVGVSLLQDTCENHRLALPNKVFEYVAAGVPVVASDLPEVAALVRGEDIGWVVRPDDPAAVAERLREALASRRAPAPRPALHWDAERSRLLDVYARFGRRRRVCMLVYNNCTRDARVLKEAASLTGAGYEVCIAAVLDRTTVPHELRDGIRIVRIDRNPPHYRLLRGTRRLRRELPGRVAAARTRWQDVRRRARRVLQRTVRLAARLSPPFARRLYRRLPAWVPGTVALLARPPRPRRGLLEAVDRRLSAVAYRSVMAFHKPLLYQDWYRRTYRRLAGGRFDVVHAHDLNTLPVAAALARRMRSRLVFDAHELYPEVSTLSPAERRAWHVIERALIREPDHVFTVCESIATELVQRHAITRPTVLLNCPAANGRIEVIVENPLRAAAGITDPAEPIVLYQGGFAPHRGLPELVAAASLLERGTVVLMGWGAIEDELDALIRAGGLTRRVRLVPPVPPEQVLAYATHATVGVIPYQPVGLNNLYTTPNKLFDYIAAGLAVAGSRLPELERFVDGMDLGATFDPYDVGDIARALNSLVSDPARLAHVRERVAEVRERFTWATVERELLGAYARLDDRRRPPTER